jgi:hypothetical protein
MQHVFPYIKPVKIYIMHGLCYHVTHRYVVVNRRQYHRYERGRAAVNENLFPPVTVPLFTRTWGTSFLISNRWIFKYCMVYAIMLQRYVVVSGVHMVIFVPVIRGPKDSFYA